MIQRILYNALTNGLAQIKADPTILDDIFDKQWELPVTEVDAIKTFFATKAPKVIHGYARSDQEPPFYSIVLVSEREADAVIGDEAGIVLDEEDPDYGCDQYAALWEHTYHVMCFTEHPDACQYIYEVAKSIILTAKPTFIPKGIYDSNLSGADLLPDPRYVPEFMFVRQLAFTCKAELLIVNKDSKLSKAFRVGGMHIDKSGSPSDVGNVKTLITIANS